jgi:hypothetical protein
VWPLGELAPGDADHPVAEGGQVRVARAVLLERGRGQVGGGAVGLDDQVVVGPVEVGFVDAAPVRVQSATPDSLVHAAASDPQHAQLLGADHPLLPRRDLSDSQIHGWDENGPT